VIGAISTGQRHAILAIFGGNATSILLTCMAALS